MSAEVIAAAGDGALHLLRQPLAVAMLLALVLVARDVSPRHAALALASAAAGAAGTMAIAPAAWHPTFAAVALAGIGLMAASAITWRPALLLATCGVGGVALGVAGGLSTAFHAEAVGALLACGLLLVATWTVWRRGVSRQLPGTIRTIGPRMVASWLSAVGLLMTALAMSGG
jgi:hypothetical protein